MPAERTYTIQVLGRTLEHLGAQMYKRRDTAIAELVANCWDAGAANVRIFFDTGSTYHPSTSKIVIQDDGIGMDADQVQTDYLVVGRNRRQAGASTNPEPSRLVMGRKGIGKLAGFGIARRMRITTWRDDSLTEFVLDMGILKASANQVASVEILAQTALTPPPELGPHGTKIVLEQLKHTTPIGQAELLESLARRFSRSTRGEMNIWVNDAPVSEPELEFELEYPAPGEVAEAELEDGSVVAYRYGFALKPLQSPQLRGFAIYVNGKIAQAPGFFFGVEGTASGQHGTRYLNGEIRADFLDAGTDDESDIISTDRQEIDWEAQETKLLQSWGQELTRRLLREWATRKGEKLESSVMDNPEVKARVKRLDSASQKLLSKYLRTLGQADAEPERALELADSVIRAFEYQHFHDVIEDIDSVADDPVLMHDLLEKLSEWKVLEGRAILEVINGRLAILEKFNHALVLNMPETAPTGGAENLHDLIASYPWLMDPEWQVLEEERGISKLLREWHVQTSDADDQSRIDFLALQGNGRLLIIEIKRSGHMVVRDNVRRLEDYADRLAQAHPNIEMVFISGDHYDSRLLDTWPHNVRRLTWAQVYERTSSYYEQYRAILEGDVKSLDFKKHADELQENERVLTQGAYRDKGGGRAPLGGQSAAYPMPLPTGALPPAVPVAGEQSEPPTSELDQES